MNEQDINQKLQAIEIQLEKIEKSTEATRKYLLWTFIVTVVVFILPLIGLIFAVPAMLSSYNAALNF